MVATASAGAPIEAAAPTTLLVSCTASAQNRPYVSGPMPAQWPSHGKTTSATPLRRNTTASATPVSATPAPIAGASAAIALPPQIAVPADTKSESFFSSRSHRPSSQPAASVAEIVATATPAERRPTVHTTPSCSPKPSSTTEALSNCPDQWFVRSRTGLPSSHAASAPATSASAGGAFSTAAHAASASQPARAGRLK